MYEIIKNVIERKNYELTDILKKIKTLWAESELTDDQKEELVKLAQDNALAENSYAPLQNQINALFENMREFAQVVVTIKEYLTKLGVSFEPTTDVSDEYPEYVQPTGAHDSYKVGDKVSYNGKKYECVLDNCVWTPDDYPQGWSLVE